MVRKKYDKAFKMAAVMQVMDEGKKVSQKKRQEMQSLSILKCSIIPKECIPHWDI